ncbi:hypothetical protein M407DRAFT_157723 [Tulasnella calospora MUT 4182]|uniref:Protein kinase domain-containing protein n=1 Tax=Tulasnella calospora MUT 4182 TaxID=1051891 RepID=A0A0C3PUK9_9AGAM|nr:hypothetical protein M407DRAFT_157723 [Tulasnella calospora MUT 4182]
MDGFVEASKRGDSSQTTTSRYFELLCDLPPSNMYLLMYIAETLDYIGRHARVEVSSLAKTFADSVFRPQAPARPRQTAIEILKDLISHRDLDAQLLRLNRRTDEQSVDVTIRGATRLDYVVSLAQQQSIPIPDIEVDAVESPDNNPTTDVEAESVSQQTARVVGAPPHSLSPDTGPWTSISSLDGVPDLSEYIKKDQSAGKKWGGFCEVYVGNYDKPETSEPLLVALRLPNMRHAADATQRRFIREVRLWFGLKHRNINPLLGTFFDEYGIHMVSPWRRRGDVFSLLKSKQLNPADTEKILLGVSNALCYLHGEGYVHGDLKMENVLLSDDGEPLLTDFGLSKGENISVMTSTGNGACSYPWSAPEVLMGDSKSRSSDVYAFGMMIIETLTWNQPFPNSNVGSLVLAIMAGKRPDRMEVDRDRAPRYWESLWKLAESCWPQDATARPPIHHVHGLLTSAMA